MKTYQGFVASLVLIGLSAAAHAAQMSSPLTAKLQPGHGIKGLTVQSFDTTTSPGAAPTTPTPVRQAKVKIEIIKSTFVQNGTDFSFKHDVVCTQEVSMDVYDFGNSSVNGITFDKPFAVCQSMFGGQPITLNAEGAIVSSQSKLFADEGNETLKSALIVLVPAPVATVNAPPPAANSAQYSWAMASGESNWSNMILTLSPTDTGENCASTNGAPPTCTTNHPEFFSATARITD